MLSSGLPALIMEWIDGRNLSEIIQDSDGGVPEEQAVEWMHDVCQGMSVASSEGIIHRDLKPSNILIDKVATAKVADFGLARDIVESGDVSVSNEVIGTPHYMSPEQAESPRRIDVRTDIYSFGATFYHALTGVPMFRGDSAFAILFKHKTEPVIPCW